MMERKEIIKIIDGMIDCFKNDLNDEELMSIKCTHKNVAEANLRQLKSIKRLLNE